MKPWYRVNFASLGSKWQNSGRRLVTFSWYLNNSQACHLSKVSQCLLGFSWPFNFLKTTLCINFKILVFYPLYLEAIWGFPRWTLEAGYPELLHLRGRIEKHGTWENVCPASESGGSLLWVANWSQRMVKGVERIRQPCSWFPRGCRQAALHF